MRRLRLPAFALPLANQGIPASPQIRRAPVMNPPSRQRIYLDFNAACGLMDQSPTCAWAMFDSMTLAFYFKYDESGPIFPKLSSSARPAMDSVRCA